MHLKFSTIIINRNSYSIDSSNQQQNQDFFLVLENLSLHKFFCNVLLRRTILSLLWLFLTFEKLFLINQHHPNTYICTYINNCISTNFLISCIAWFFLRLYIVSATIAVRTFCVHCLDDCAEIGIMLTT